MSERFERATDAVDRAADFVIRAANLDAWPDSDAFDGVFEAACDLLVNYFESIEFDDGPEEIDDIDDDEPLGEDARAVIEAAMRDFTDGVTGAPV